MKVTSIERERGKNLNSSSFSKLNGRLQWISDEWCWVPQLNLMFHNPIPFFNRWTFPTSNQQKVSLDSFFYSNLGAIFFHKLLRLSCKSEHEFNILFDSLFPYILCILFLLASNFIFGFQPTHFILWGVIVTIVDLDPSITEWIKWWKGSIRNSVSNELNNHLNPFSI